MHNGSCFYHAYSDIIRPHLGSQTPSPWALKETLKKFYADNDGELKKNLERLLGVSFRDCYKDVCSPSHWGQFDDALCLATLMRVKFYIITVESTSKLRVLHREEVTGKRK